MRTVPSSSRLTSSIAAIAEPHDHVGEGLRRKRYQQGSRRHEQRDARLNDE
jgi:hypothetical protein